MFMLGQAPTYSDHMADVFAPARGAATATAATTAAAQPLTLDTLQRIAEAVQAVPADPLAQRMAADGFDPKQGGILVLPESYRADEWGPFGPPGYVRFSAHVSAPIYGRDPLSNFFNPTESKP